MEGNGNNTPKAPFDKTAEYNEHIKPLMKQVFDACRKYNFPMMSSVVYKVDDDGSPHTEDMNIDGYGTFAPDLAVITLIQRNQIPPEVIVALLECAQHKIDGSRAVEGEQPKMAVDSEDGLPSTDDDDDDGSIVVN